MHSRHGETLARTDRMLRSVLRPAHHRTLATARVRHFPVGSGQDEPIPAADVLDRLDELDWQDVEIGSPWGPAWGTSWFEITGQVPEGHRDLRHLELMIDLGWLDHSVGFQSEGLVYRADGSIVKALNPRNGWIPLTRTDGTDECDEQGRYRFYVEAAANPLLLDVPPFDVTYLGEKQTAGPAPLYRLARADLTQQDWDIAALIIDLEVCSELAAVLPESEPRRARLLAALDDALDVLRDTDLPGTARQARDLLAAVLALPASASAHQIWATGHAHIDSAWLWPLRETIRKVARTVANQLSLLDRFPEHIYAMSSAQQYAWLEEHYPQLFERLTRYVAKGRFVPVGGMWVESDTLMPSGEAMARQFVYGKRYFASKFGIEPREVWLPDSFGYSGALPQLTKLAGFEFFLTQKISWSDTNKFPHHTFWWEGIDGSRVFTHFPPADTYNGEITGRELAHAVANFRDKARSSHSLLPFGYGDGGGGPTREMIARIDRFADTEGAPRIVRAAPIEFFEAARAEYQAAPVWKGELYLELHRGTYTSQHATKRGNRRCETLLLEAERAATAATLLVGAPYPYDRLEEAWRTVLLHQFHDILPGSSIAWVHREAAATYARIEAELTAIVAEARAAIAPKQAPTIAPKGATITAPGPDGGTDGPATVSRTADGWLLANSRCQARFNDAGEIVSLAWDGGPDLVAPGTTLGRLELFADQPVQWDAWDIDRSAERRPVPTTASTAAAIRIEPIGEGGRAGLRITRQVSESPVVQDVVLAAGSPMLQFEFDIDWRERERLLKFALPLDLDTDRAQFETQYGYLTRDITDNTSWQWAQHEVCTQRFVRVSQGDRAVAILNDSSYGLSLTRDEREGGGSHVTARVSLLRAPRFPDPNCDLGRHTLRLALIPAPTPTDAALAARALGHVTEPVGADALPQIAGPSTALIEAVKLADDRSGDLVVRVYESAGAPCDVRIEWPDGCGAPEVADLLERTGADAAPDLPRTELTHAAGTTCLRLRAFQVLTLRASLTR